MENNNHLQTSYADTNSNKNVYYGMVVSTDDMLQSGRIKVRIKGVDDKLTDADLPFCEAILPMFLNIIPKVDELVKVFVFNSSKPSQDRIWIGPIISDVTTLEKDTAITALSGSNNGKLTKTQKKYSALDLKDVYADKEDIAFQGRNNTDIIHKDKEIQIRAGKFVYTDKKKLNTKNPAIIQLKYRDDSSSSAKIIADKIYFISNQGSPKYKTLLSDEIEQEIEKTAHPMVYGDVLVEFCKLLVEYVNGHIHAPELPSDEGTGRKLEILAFDFKRMLSDHIKFN